MCSFFLLQVKVSFDLDNIQIKYIDEDNDEVKSLAPHPPNKSAGNWLLAEMTFCLLMVGAGSFRRGFYADWGGGMFAPLIRK